MDPSFGFRLKRLRILRGLSQEQLGKLIGITKQAVSHYEAGEVLPNVERVREYARALNVDSSVLIGAPGNTSLKIILSAAGVVGVNKPAVPLIGQLSRPDSLFDEANIEEYLLVPDGMTADFALRCSGQAMINARLYEGDVVYLSQRQQAGNGSIAAVIYRGEMLLRRVYNYSSRLLLRAENPLFEDINIEGEALEQTTIAGCAVGFASKLL